MNIAVNTRLLIKNRLEGIGGFSFEVLRRMVVNRPEHTFFFIFDRKYDPSFLFAPNVKAIVAPPQARHPILYFIWFEMVIPKILIKIQADIFLSPDGYLSLRSNIRQVAVIHDLNFEHYPQDLPWLERWNYRYFFPRYAHKAARIATVSSFSKMDIVNSYQIAPDKIDLVSNGSNDDFQPVSDVIKKEVRAQFTKGFEYFICVGSIHPRKNLVNLLKAFDRFKNETKSEVKLIVVGQKKWWSSEMAQTLNQLQHASAVVFTGRVSNEELEKLLASALALTYVSYYEGFGLPILEAFRCGTPVITSQVTSMPEVAGEAALLVDPFSPDSIAAAMKQVFEDESLRKDLVARGEERCKLFSWQTTSEKLWNCIEKVLA